MSEFKPDGAFIPPKHKEAVGEINEQATVQELIENLAILEAERDFDIERFGRLKDQITAQKENITPEQAEKGLHLLQLLGSENQIYEQLQKDKFKILSQDLQTVFYNSSVETKLLEDRHRTNHIN